MCICILGETNSHTMNCVPYGRAVDYASLMIFLLYTQLPPAEDILEAMTRAGTGLDIRDRRHIFTVYPRCVVGRDVVDWMIQALPALQGSRRLAADLGQRLVLSGHVSHVKEEHDFEDAYLFYNLRPEVKEPWQAPVS